MHKKSLRVYVGLLILLLSGFAPGPVAAAEENSSEQGLEKLVLDNGMTFLLRDLHSAPMIASLIVVNAGAADEEAANNGVTHFLEHLLFNGTARRSREEIYEEMDLIGGYNNAFTRKDYTSFFILVPSPYIDEALDIQADMLFGSIIPEEILQKERGIVTEEIRKDTDSVEYKAQQLFESDLFRGTPYEKPVLGFEQTIASIPRQQIIDYYHRYYTPRNMTALVVGDFDRSEMEESLKRTFGRFTSQEEPPVRDWRFEFPEESRKTIHYLDTDYPILDMAFPAPAVDSKELAGFRMLVELLNRRSSPLQKKLLDGDSAPATSVSASLDARRNASILQISVRPKPGRTMDALNAIPDALTEFADAAVNDRALNSLKTQKIAEELKLEESFHYYGMMKSSVLACSGAQGLEGEAERIDSVTPEVVKGLAERYFSRPRYVASIVLPRDQQAKASSAKKQTWIRETLPNGMTVLVSGSPDSRVFAATVLARNRALLEPKEKAGCSDLISRLLLRGTKSMGPEELETRLAELGASVSTVDNPYIPYDDYRTSPEYAYIRYESIDRFDEPGLELLAEMIFEPAFDAAEMEKARGELLVAVNMKQASSSQEAKRLFFSSLLGDSPLARPVMGTPDTIASITHDDLASLHSILYSPENLILTVTGNRSSEELLELVRNYFGKQPAGPKRDAVQWPDVDWKKKTKDVISLPQEDKGQLSIQMGSLLPPLEGRERDALKAAVWVLSDRLQEELREGQGLAYSIGASLGFYEGFGLFRVSMGTGPENYEKAREGILGEIEKMRNQPPEPRELKKVINGLWGRELMRRLTRVNQSFFAGLQVLRGRDLDEHRTWRERYVSLGPEEILEAARTHLDAEKFLLVWVGAKPQ